MDGNSLCLSSEPLHISNQNDYIETAEDWDLRTPIAPPMTSLEGAMVIFMRVHLEKQKSAGNESLFSYVRQNIEQYKCTKEE